MARTLDMVVTSTLDTELKLAMMFKLGEAAAFIATTQSITREAKFVLDQVQELVLSHSYSPTPH
jgi:hypothetical protein